MKISVTSKSFSTNIFLKDKLLEVYPQSQFNDQGLSFNTESLIQFLKNSDAAIIGLEKINSHVLSSLPNLKIISKYGVGLDNINLSDLASHSVKIGYTPGTNKRGVAELALQMMLILIRQSYIANSSLRNGSWKPAFGNNLTGKKIGILGLGNIGKDLVTLLKPFNCQISCCDTNPDMSFIDQNSLELVAIEKLFSNNDIVTIHIPLNENNRFLVNRNLLDLMNPNAILINTARGALVDEETLKEKLLNHSLAAAGFDVFQNEPFKDNELINLPNFYATPHIGGSSIESVHAMGLAAIAGLSSAEFVTKY